MRIDIQFKEWNSGWPLEAVCRKSKSDGSLIAEIALKREMKLVVAHRGF